MLVHLEFYDDEKGEDVLVEVPVTRKTLSVIFPSRRSSVMIWRAVGRASPGPFWFSGLWDSAYLPGMVGVLGEEALSGVNLGVDLLDDLDVVMSVRSMDLMIK